MAKIDWAQRWSDGHIGFHQQTVTDALATYTDQVWGEGSLGRVLVPLCGKTLDMVYLAERATAVVGVEYVEQAVQEFFAERDVTPEVRPGPPVSYSSGPWTVFASDFFAVTADDLGPIDAVFDRASLVALPPETRVRYADHMRSLLPPGAKMLLITYPYDQTQMSGPPFSVLPDEVERLFGTGFTLEHLRTRDVLNDIFRQRGLTEMAEYVVALTRLAD